MYFSLVLEVLELVPSVVVELVWDVLVLELVDVLDSVTQFRSIETSFDRREVAKQELGIQSMGTSSF